MVTLATLVIFAVLVKLYNMVTFDVEIIFFNKRIKFLEILNKVLLNIEGFTRQGSPIDDRPFPCYLHRLLILNNTSHKVFPNFW